MFFSLFVKPSSQHIFLNYHSSHPKSVILNSARNEIRRARVNSSTPELEKYSVNQIVNMLRKNDYPDNVINKLVGQSKTNNCSTQEVDKGNERVNTYLSLPYIDEQTCRKVYYALRTNKLLENTKVSFTSGKRLVDSLTKSSLQHTQCNKQSDSKCYQCDKTCMVKNICYQLKCNICDKRYIGETGRMKRKRNWEHFRSVHDKTRDTAMGKHYLAEHPYTPAPKDPFEFTVKQRCRDFVDRQLWQSALIKREQPELNIQLSELHKDGDWSKSTWQIM